MNSAQRERLTFSQHVFGIKPQDLVLFFALIWGIWASLSCPVWATIDIQTDGKSLWLDDGSSLEIAEDAIALYEPATDTQESRIQWSVPADRPRQILLFETSAHGQCLFYISPQPDRQVDLRALRLTDGHEIWITPITLGASIDSPVGPVFVPPWIYLGRGTWLEQIDPEDGSIVQRYPLRELIKSLYVSSDGSIDVVVETSEAGQLSIRFRDGVWFPRITVSSSLSGSSLLLNRATEVMWDFAGALDSWGYYGYLDLLRVKKEPVYAEDIIEFRNFDLEEAEDLYKEAARRDRANPYLTLYQAFALYYQEQQEAASALIEETLRRSASFWEESIRLGAICDSLGHTAWADAFYEQGTALYFREIPAPSQEASVDEVLALLLQEQSSALFANGRTDRALQLLDIRRRIFPYTEGDNLFSRKYAVWLQANGQEEKARQEQQRIERRGLVFELVTVTPFSVWNFAGLIIVFLYLIILKNDIRHWSELIALVLIIVLIDFVATLDVLGELSLPARTAVHTLGLLGYIIVLALLRRRRDPSSQSVWESMASATMSSYVVLIRGTLPAYYLGLQLTKSEVGAKWGELLFIIGFLSLYLLLRRRRSNPPVLRHGRLLVLGLICYICWSAWLHYWGSYGIITMNFPYPWADKGHPNWVAYIDQQAENAEFRKQDVQFLQALVYQLRGEADFAKQLYEPLTRDVRALNNLGVLALEQSRDTAQAYFQQALQQNPDYAPARYNLTVLAGYTQGNPEQAQIYTDAWLPTMYQRYAPERLWIANPPLKEWCSILYWSRGGFWYKSLLEPMVRFTNPAKLFQTDLQQLR